MRSAIVVCIVAKWCGRATQRNQSSAVASQSLRHWLRRDSLRERSLAQLPSDPARSLETLACPAVAASRASVWRRLASQSLPSWNQIVEFLPRVESVTPCLHLLAPVGGLAHGRIESHRGRTSRVWRRKSFQSTSVSSNVGVSVCRDGCSRRILATMVLKAAVPVITGLKFVVLSPWLEPFRICD